MITKRQYYLRLKDMIENCPEISSTCPMWKKRGGKWQPSEEVAIKEAADPMEFLGVKMEVCRMCRDFLTKNEYKCEDTLMGQSWRLIKVPKCPCIVFGEKKAIRLAKEAIARYERGEHRWQREGQSK